MRARTRRELIKSRYLLLKKNKRRNKILVKLILISVPSRFRTIYMYTYSDENIGSNIRKLEVHDTTSRIVRY